MCHRWRIPTSRDISWSYKANHFTINSSFFQFHNFILVSTFWPFSKENQNFTEFYYNIRKVLIYAIEQLCVFMAQRYSSGQYRCIPKNGLSVELSVFSTNFLMHTFLRFDPVTLSRNAFFAFASSSLRFVSEFTWKNIENVAQIKFFNWQPPILKFFKNPLSKMKVSLYDDTNYENLQFLKYLPFNVFLWWKQKKVSKLSVVREKDFCKQWNYYIFVAGV